MFGRLRRSKTVGIVSPRRNSPPGRAPASSHPASASRGANGLENPPASPVPSSPTSLDSRAVRGAVRVERATDSGPRWRAPSLYLAGWLAGALPAFALITLLWLLPGTTTPFGIIGLGAYALAFPVMVRRLGIPRRPEFLTFLVVAGIAFAVVSIVTGWANQLTDEGFTTPRFASFVLSGHDPYTTALKFSYVAYGRQFTSMSYYVYLPLLMFLQVPGLPYKWFSLACWVATVAVVRKRFDVALMLAQPYVMLVAANGYNDLTVLLLLTVAFVGVEGRRPKWVEWLALGCKQFANVFVLAYYAVRRDWRNFVVTLGVSAAFVVPFLLWGGTAVLCPTIVANRLPSCPHTGGVQLLINYPVWVVWVAAIFYGSAFLLLRAALSRRPHAPSASRAMATVPFERWPSLGVVALSAVVTGLGGFAVVGALAGFVGAGAMLAGVAAAGAAALWSWAWGGPWSYERLPEPQRRRSLGRIAACQLALVVVEVAAVGTAEGARTSTLLAGALGLIVGVATSYYLLVAWGLPAETTPEAPSPPGASSAAAPPSSQS
jgi:hypothetical protein